MIVNLDNLTYDPDYKYVTGFYIKNDAGFLQTVYIDDVNLLMIDNGGQPAPAVLSGPTDASTPTPTPELTPTDIPTASDSITSTPGQ